MSVLRSATAVKFAIFVTVMAVLTGFLFLVFANTRTGATTGYSAVFDNVSDLRAGDTVRVAGVRVGTVSDMRLGADKRVTVAFDADQNVKLTAGTRVAVRYLNLVGDRYLELIDGPGSTRLLAPGSVIPVDRTSPALDLDLLLGGLKPVIQGLNAQQVNALTSSLLQIMQGQEGTLNSLLSKTSSFTSALADNDQVIEQLIDNLKVALGTLATDGDKFSATVDRLERVVTELSQQRDTVGSAIDSLANGTASIADLLTQARPPLAGTIAQLARLAPNLDQEKDRLDYAIGRAPENFRKLARVGAYGNWIQYYLCDATIRLNDPQGRVLVLPFMKQNYGRCQ
jgi:phospholipid/cholesterol/gamma-HCH transport system substrate-binding protein